MIGRKVTEALTVSPQIGPDDVPEIEAAGFRTILCNRPDGEAPDQSDFAAIEAAARKAGLEVRHQPVVSGRLTEEDVKAFEAAIEELPAPVFAYCRSGTRCITLWALAESARRPTAEILELAKAAGYDLGG